MNKHYLPNSQDILTVEKMVSRFEYGYLKTNSYTHEDILNKMGIQLGKEIMKSKGKVDTEYDLMLDCYHFSKSVAVMEIADYKKMHRMLNAQADRITELERALDIAEHKRKYGVATTVRY